MIKQITRKFASIRMFLIRMLLISLFIVLLLALVFQGSKNNRFQRTNIFSSSYQTSLSNVDIVSTLSVEKEKAKIEIKRNDSTLQMALPMQNAKLEKIKEEMVYSIPEKNIEARYQTLPNGIKEEIVLLKKPAPSSSVIPEKSPVIPEESVIPGLTRNPETTMTKNFQLQTILNLTNLSIKETPGGVLAFYNKNGSYQFNFEKPFVKDAKGNISYDVKYTLKEQKQKKLLSPLSNIQTPQKGGKKSLLALSPVIDLDSNGITTYVLSISIDEKWLFDPERVYPIVIDPTVVRNTQTGAAGFNQTGSAFNRVTDTGVGETAPNLTTFYQEAGKDNSLVGLWHMNEGVGTTTADSSGNGNTGTATGTTIVSGKFGNARNFSTTSDYVSTGNINNSFLQKSYTFEAWAKSSGTTIGSIIRTSASGIDTSMVTNWTSLDANAANKLTCGHYSGTWTGQYTIGTTNVLDGQWHHFGCTFDGTTLKVFVDGKEENSKTVAIPTVGTTAWWIGRYPVSATENFQGIIDEVSIYNRALSPEEIKLQAQRRPYSVYTSEPIDLTNVASWNSLSWTELGVRTGDGEIPFGTSSLVSQWNFNEASGTTATNSAGASSCGGTPANCNGTLTGFTYTASQDQAAGTGWTANNKRWGAGALMFDGSNDYIAISDNNSLDINSDFTIETWMNGSISLTNQADWAALVAKYRGTSSYENYGIVVGNGEFLRGLYGSSGGEVNVDTIGFSPQPGNWYHIVLIHNSTNDTLKIYINGVLNNSNNSATATPVVTDGDLRFGYTQSTATYFKGSLDSTRIYSRALTAAEIMSNYQAGNIEFQTRVGASANPNDGTWEAWKPTANESQIDSMDTSSEKWGVDNYQNSSSTINKISGINLGTGADGACIIDNGTKTLDATAGATLCNGSSRTPAYAVNFSDTTLEKTGETSVTVSTTPTDLAVGDEILIINLQGTSTNYNGVGQYETHIISSISTNDLNFTDYPLQNSYDGTTQKIMVQRVPNFGAVTVCGGNTGGGCTAAATLTATAWNGTKNGVLFFRSTGTVTVNSGGTMDVSGRGYRGGTEGAGCAYPWPTNAGDHGESANGQNAIAVCSRDANVIGNLVAVSPNYGGGGGGGASTGSGRNGGGGGGGSYAIIGGNGTNSSTGENGASAGSIYGSAALQTIFMGSGGGGGGSGVNASGGTGGVGGGIVSIYANIIINSNSVFAKGSTGGTPSTSDDGGGGAGGGAGGSILINGNSVTLGSSTTLASGGSGSNGTSGTYGTGGNGGTGGSGRVAVYYTSSLSGTTTPVAYTQKYDSQIKMEGTGAAKLSLGAPQVDSATVGLWHLDEVGVGTGSTAYDVSGNNNNGTATGTTLADGFSGKARSFNGTSDYVSVSEGNLGLTRFTLEAWVKPNSAVDAYIIDKSAAGSTNYMIDIESSKFTVGFYDSAWHQAVSSTTVSTGIWYYLTGTYDGSVLRLYVNGIQDGTPLSYGGTPLTGQNLKIGTRYNNTYYFNGSIDEVRISNTARTAEEIAETYRAGRDHRISRTFTSTDLSARTKLPFYVASDRLGTNMEATIGESAYANYEPDANTVGLWHLEENWGTGNSPAGFIKDSSSGGNNGTATGTTFVQGKIGKGRSFNGSSDVIISSSNINITGTSTRTLSFWAKANATGNQGIVGWGASATNNYFIALIWSGHWYLNAYGANDWDTGINADTNWHQHAIVYDGTNLIWYVDGVSIGTVTRSLATTATTLEIGRRRGINDGYFNGIVDEVRVDNVIRTPDEIRQAYEYGSRTHPITIDFKASIGVGTTASSSSLLLTVDENTYGSYLKASHVYLGDKIILKETVGATEYLAQGTVSAVNSTTGAVSVAVWDTGSTFPTAGFDSSATVFKWQREYFDITGSLSTQRDAITRITTRIIDGSQGSNVWFDDFRSGEPYLSTPAGSTITSSTGYRYFQYRAIPSSWDTNVSPSLTSVTLDYVSNDAPTTPTIENYKYFDNAKIGSTAPVFNFKSTDGDGDRLIYNLQISTDNLFGTTSVDTDSSVNAGFLNTVNVGDTSPFTQNQTISYTTQSALSNGTTYWYRVRAKDPAGINTWTSWTTARSFTIDTTLSRDIWHQTTAAQFATGTMTGTAQTNPGGYVEVVGSDDAFGNGADGACIINTGSINIGTTSCSGRSTADMINTAASNNIGVGTSSISVGSTAGLAVNDEVLIINLQGTGGDYANVGKYETKTISYMNSATIGTSTTFAKNFDGTTQKIMVQRVPNYTTVSVGVGATMTGPAWDGTKGGVLFYRASVSIGVSGVIDMSGKGYSNSNKLVGLSTPGGTGGGGSGGDGMNSGYAGGGGGGGQGGSYGVGATMPFKGGGGGGGGARGGGIGGSGGGGGGGSNNGVNGSGWGLYPNCYPPSQGGAGGDGLYSVPTPGSGGAPATQGTAGGNAGNNTSGSGSAGAGGSSGNGGNGSPAGTTYGTQTLTTLFMGSQGGNSGDGGNGNGLTNKGIGASGGTGGGIVMLAGSSLDVSGKINSNGNNGLSGTAGGAGQQCAPDCEKSPGGGGGGAGSGAGGSIIIASSTTNLGSNLVNALGGNGGTGAAGSVGFGDPWQGGTATGGSAGAANGGAGGGAYADVNCALNNWATGGGGGGADGSAGGSGRVAIYYASSLSGTASPTAYSSQSQTGRDLTETVSNSGTILSPPINYSWFTEAGHWQYAYWNDDETYGSIMYQIYYDVGGIATIVPDSDLAGNSVGFGTSPLDISGLRTDRYPVLYLKATLTYSGGTPKLNDWTFSAYQLQEPFLCNIAKASTGSGPLTITWEDKSNDEFQFRIEKSTDSGAFSLLTNPVANSTSYIDSSVSSSHTYQYRIRGETNSGNAITSWCTTAVENLGIGNFRFEGLKFGGIILK